MPTERINFGPWRPDQARIPQPIISAQAGDVNNVYPEPDASVGVVWRGYPGQSVASDVAPATPLGGGSVTTRVGDVLTLIGSTAALYQLNDDQTWTNVTRASGVYTTAAAERWRFIGVDNYACATNFTDKIQLMDTTSAVVFSDAHSSAPRCRHLGTLQRALVAMNTQNGDSEIWGSDQSVLSQWAVGAASSRAFKAFLTVGGAINGSFEADALYVFQERAIHYVQYVGGGSIVNIQLISNNRGQTVPDSGVSFGSRYYYWSDDGVKMFAPPTEIVDLGYGKIDKWLIDNYNTADLVTAAVDQRRSLIVWLFSTNDNASGIANKALFYNIATNEFGKGDISARFIFSAQTLDVGLDTIELLIDNVDVLIDDPIYSGGSSLFCGINASNEFVTFSAPPGAQTIETGLLQVGLEDDAYLQWVEPITTAAYDALTINHARQQRLDQNGAYNVGSYSVGARGRAWVRQRGKYHKLQLTVAAGQPLSPQHQGLDVTFMGGGRR